MPSFTIRIGALLVVFGLAGYVITQAASLTALIPAVVGVILVLLGLLGLRQAHLRKHVMHVALLVGVIGLAGSIGGLVALPSALAAGAVRPAVVLRASMALLLLVYLVIGIKSFVDARRARTA
jgi:uncharacterized membrane protein